ncbi:MAG: class I tRNA ligase family protein, partial [Leifsonia sp.]
LEQVTQHLDDLDSPFAANALRDFGDVLTNWYVRRSRDRFWGGDDHDAFDTLFTVLENLCRMAAPLLPLVTEEIWRGLTGGRSVHLTHWPDATLFPEADELIEAMDRVRQIASSGLALRKARGLRVRLPLAALTVVSENTASLEGFLDILKDELNVKTVDLRPLTADSLGEFGITHKLTVNARALGPRIGKDVQKVIKAAKAGDWFERRGTVTVGGFELLPEEYELEPQAEGDARAISFLPDGGFVLLDTVTTPELEAEGLARDLVRAIQDTRKAAQLDVSDRISLTLYFGSDEEAAAVAPFGEMIAQETLAEGFAIVAPDGTAGSAGDLAALHGSVDAYRSLVNAQKYANTHDVVVELKII